MEEEILDIYGNPLSEECLEELSAGYDPEEDEVSDNDSE